MISELWNFIKENPEWAGSLAMISFLFLLGLLFLTPRILAKLPRDYFHNPHHRPLESFLSRPVLRVILLILKNVLGVLLAVAGLGMLVLPGQGLLTLLVALILIDFPGKFAVKRKVISVPLFHKMANSIRHKKGKEPFLSEH